MLVFLFGSQAMLKIMKESVEDLYSPNLWLAIPAEMLGTLFITLLGCGTWSMSGGVSSNSSTAHEMIGSDHVLQVALTFGLAVGTMVWIFSHQSGGYFNPAVTLAALFTRRLSIIRGFLYIVSQIVGGIIGAGILYGLTPEDASGLLGVNLVSDNITSAQGFGVELLITFVLVLAYFSSQDDKRTDVKGSWPLTIGLSVVACHLFAVPFTRASMNPARSFGPAVILGQWEDHWVFWVGPVVGAVVAGLLYEYIFASGATFDGAKKCLLRTKKPRRQPEPEKAPLEEVKADVIEIDETKVDGEEKKEEEAATVVEVETDKAKIVVEEVNEKEKEKEKEKDEK